MSIKRYIEKIKFIDFLIRTQSTGQQKKFAQKVSLSVSSLNIYLSEMKNLGFPISYDKRKGTYYYEQAGKMVDSLFEPEEYLTSIEMREQKGGRCLRPNTFMSPTFFLINN